MDSSSPHTTHQSARSGDNHHKENPPMEHGITPTTPTIIQATANRLHQFGANVLPVGNNKAPILKSWWRFTVKPQCQDDVLTQDWPRAPAVGVVHGVNGW